MSHGLIIEVGNLTHHYGQRTALRDVSFTIDRPMVFGVLGPNGGGKTTLFRILSTALTPSAGVARVYGADVVLERQRVRERIGVVFQNPSLDGKLSVLENLHTHALLYRLGGASLRERCDSLLARFDLSDRAGERVDRLSGGLRRRVEIAKALLHKPSVLILDEPGTGLDLAARLALMSYLSELRDRDGVTSLLTTHLMDEADRCDRLGVLDQSRLVAMDAPAALKARVGGDVLTIAAHEPASLAEKVRQRFDVDVTSLDGQLRVERSRGHEFVPQLIEAFPGEIQSVTLGKPTLEDVFVDLTGHRL